jgi:phosphoglycolate phosphatase
MAELVGENVCLNPVVILFDWDGVLVDTKDLIKEAYLRTFEAVGQEPLPIDTLHQLPGTSLRDYFPHIFGAHAKKAEAAFYHYIHENHLSCLKKTEGAKELLEFLHSLDIPMAVISNKRGDILRKEIKHLGFEPFFFAVVGSKDCAEDKPSTVPVRYILEQKNIKLPNDKVWLIGDWIADLECAHKAGIVPVLLNNPKLKRDKKNLFPPKIYLNSCLDLKNFLIQYMKKNN